MRILIALWFVTAAVPLAIADCENEYSKKIIFVHDSTAVGLISAFKSVVKTRSGLLTKGEKHYTALSSSVTLAGRVTAVDYTREMAEHLDKEMDGDVTFCLELDVDSAGVLKRSFIRTSPFVLKRQVHVEIIQSAVNGSKYVFPGWADPRSSNLQLDCRFPISTGDHTLSWVIHDWLLDKRDTNTPIRVTGALVLDLDDNNGNSSGLEIHPVYHIESFNCTPTNGVPTPFNGKSGTSSKQ